MRGEIAVTQGPHTVTQLLNRLGEEIRYVARQHETPDEHQHRDDQQHHEHHTEDVLAECRWRHIDERQTCVADEGRIEIIGECLVQASALQTIRPEKLKVCLGSEVSVGIERLPVGIQQEDALVAVIALLQYAFEITLVDRHDDVAGVGIDLTTDLETRFAGIDAVVVQDIGRLRRLCLEAGDDAEIGRQSLRHRAAVRRIDALFTGVDVDGREGADRLCLTVERRIDVRGRDRTLGQCFPNITIVCDLRDDLLDGVEMLLQTLLDQLLLRKILRCELPVNARTEHADEQQSAQDERNDGYQCEVEHQLAAVGLVDVLKHNVPPRSARSPAAPSSAVHWLPRYRRRGYGAPRSCRSWTGPYEPSAGTAGKSYSAVPDHSG